MATPFIISTPKRSKRKKKGIHKSKKTYVYGLVNQGNNVCFLNAVLQALAALHNLRIYLGRKATSRDAQDEERPMTIALHETLEKLNEPLATRDSFVPNRIVWALQANARRLINRQQQDAHELFQLLSESLGLEDEVSRRPKSLLDIDTIRFLTGNNKARLICDRNPLVGLTACRISCMKCKYCGPIRHSTFDNISIPLPKQQVVTLENLLRTYSEIEFIDEYNCPQCSLFETLAVVEKELIDRKDDPNKEYLRKLNKDKQIIKTALVTDVDKEIDSELEVTKLARVNFLASKQTMFAKLPKVFALHFSRSIYLQNGMTLKNPCSVLFPEKIDLTQYTTTGYLATMPSEPLSSPSSSLSSPLLSPMLAGIEGARPDEVHYRLKAIIAHIGDHKLGHFVTYRRREGLDCWWRLSDENIEEVKLSKVLEQEAYMLFYEKDHI
ncbi:9548_t:CDS:1 [Acaulospora colombiana]|uniref:9548_t:CDS:1 n=1 Tax=Acaulospora colombiana TaxID=27376 RepID=A0ACA9LJW7_9GLOM|nr:9548_t:CDS:1 [Acaulospora colombiana]